MAFNDIQITEIFHSIQGETSKSGLPFVFIRLTGCNLRCNYCDTAYAFKGGTRMRISDIISHVQSFGCKEVLLTGGEPLIQRNTLKLVQNLAQAGFLVSIETHGEAPIESFIPYARIIMDIKTPGSGMHRGGYKKNLPHLRADKDEVKFVLTSQNDYAWAKQILQLEKFEAKEILFSAVVGGTSAQQATGPQVPRDLTLKWLAEAIIRDRLNVRLQTQLHKLIWGEHAQGV